MKNHVLIQGVGFQIAIGVGHFIQLILVSFHRMTRGAILGSHHQVNLFSLMFKGVLVVIGIDQMALGTTHGILCVCFRGSGG